MKRRCITLHHAYGDTFGAALVRVVIRDDSAALGGGVEITCTPVEVQTIIAWARTHWGRVHASSLPVPTYTRPPWGRNYRWTMTAASAFLAAMQRAA